MKSMRRDATSNVVLLKTKDCSIKTVTITVQAMIVDSRQLTLSVFRQLPVNYVNHNDRMWGTVRYAIKDEGNRWVVFDRGGCIYRDAGWLDSLENTSSDVYQQTRELDSAKALSWTTPERIKQLEKILDDVKCYHQEALSLFKIIDALPQLFIAV